MDDAASRESRQENQSARVLTSTKARTLVGHFVSMFSVGKHVLVSHGGFNLCRQSLRSILRHVGRAHTEVASRHDEALQPPKSLS